MRPFFNLILILFFGVSSNAQNAYEDEPDRYNCDTILKGGYSISFQVDDSLQYLYLKKGGKTISELASTSRGFLQKNLGYIGGDFTHYFVLVHSFGSGNAHYIELIRKSTGKNVLNNGAAWIDIDQEKELLLYCEDAVPLAKDKMILYNIATGQKQLFSFPGDIINKPQVLNRIQISKITDKQLVIKYKSERGSMTKTYNR